MDCSKERIGLLQLKCLLELFQQFRLFRNMYCQQNLLYYSWCSSCLCFIYCTTDKEIDSTQAMATSMGTLQNQRVHRINRVCFCWQRKNGEEVEIMENINYTGRNGRTVSDAFRRMAAQRVYVVLTDANTFYDLCIMEYWFSVKM